jgi:hypothetical protein
MMLQLDLDIQSLDLQTNADKFRHKLIDEFMEIQVSNRHRLSNPNIIKRHNIRHFHCSYKHKLRKTQILDTNSQIP